MDVTQLSLLTLGVSIISTVISIFAFRAAIGANETSAMQIYFEAYRRYHEMVLKYENSLAQHPQSSEDEANYNTYRYFLAEYYNAVDYICAKYLYGGVHRKTVRINMWREIKRLWEDTARLRNFDFKRDDWENIGKVYRKLQLQYRN